MQVNNYRMNFSVVLMNKNCVQKCSSSPKITVRVGYCEFRHKIVNFDKKRSVPKEILSEVEVSVVKMIFITRDDCTYIVKSTPLRASTGSFQHFADILQTY